MKKTDIAMILLIATVSVVAAFLITRSIFGDSQKETVKVQTIERIEAAVEEPDPAIFNAEAINPAVEVYLPPAEQ